MPHRNIIGLALLTGFSLGAGSALADEFNVPADFLTIQQAINAASSGDTIHVEPGVYESIDLRGKTLIIRSTSGSDLTTIDAELTGPCVTCDEGELPGTRIEGFTLIGGAGDANLFGGGAAVIDSAAEFRDCRFTDNVGIVGVGIARGGGIAAANADLVVTGCLFEGNEAAFGGGVYFAGTTGSLALRESVLESNIGSHGGGMWLSLGAEEFGSNAEARVERCQFIGNDASFGGGARISVSNTSSAVIDACEVRANTASFGGGLHTRSATAASLVISNCVVEANNQHGIDTSHDTAATLDIVNCTIVDNIGSGIKIDTENLTPLSAMRIQSCVATDNRPFNLREDDLPAIVQYCLVQGGFVGEGNIDADPLYIDPDQGDYRLGAGSPAIDAGNNLALPVGIESDLDGNTRFVDDPETADTGNGSAPIVDMGAYEFQTDGCPADLDGDGDADAEDFFGYLDLFASGDLGADIDGDGDLDAEDFFGYLDLFTMAC